MNFNLIIVRIKKCYNYDTLIFLFSLYFLSFVKLVRVFYHYFQNTYTVYIYLYKILIQYLYNFPSSSLAQWPGIGFHRQSVKRHRLQHSVVYWKHICLRLLTQTVNYVQWLCTFDYVLYGVRSLGRYINTHFKLN